MNLDDIPLLRHLSLLGWVVKAGLLLAGLFLFPLLVLVKAGDAMQARSSLARAYFVLQMMGWLCAADAYCLPLLALFGNLLGDPAFGNGEMWVHLMSLFSKRRGIDLVLAEIVLQAGLSLLFFVLAWCLGTDDEHGLFIPRAFLRSANDR